MASCSCHDNADNGVCRPLGCTIIASRSEDSAGEGSVVRASGSMGGSARVSGSVRVNAPVSDSTGDSAQASGSMWTSAWASGSAGGAAARCGRRVYSLL
jgi:hypothetical protein